ncbi:microtubule nucleation factor SSNA1 isoform X1 [Physcomitrium patens]|uniref:microtubule nucleation factor SSNA1 isoform X1 n=1 Tax=Physcomitrium patens TaxID=3218 RepID=UPI003CCD3400
MLKHSINCQERNIYNYAKSSRRVQLRPGMSQTLRGLSEHFQRTRRQLICEAWHGIARKAVSYEVDLGIEELMKKRDSMKRVVQLEEEEKANIQRDLTALTKRLTEIDESLSRKYACVEDYENTIHNVESAYSKILESSQALLQVLQSENCNHISQCAR